jgi:hypothetical protein
MVFKATQKVPRTIIKSQRPIEYWLKDPFSTLIGHEALVTQLLGKANNSDSLSNWQRE